MIILDMEQRSPEWFEARRGIPTASSFSKIITPKTGNLSSQCDDLIAQLICELIDDLPEEEPFSTVWMERGEYTEEEARDWYAFRFDKDVEQVGFILNDDRTAGASPDGVIRDDQFGLLEIKCPKPAVHVRYLMDAILPDQYRPQVHGALHISGADYLDFVSYCPGLKPMVIRVLPDEYTEKVGAALSKFHTRYEKAKRLVLPDDADRGDSGA